MQQCNKNLKYKPKQEIKETTDLMPPSHPHTDRQCQFLHGLQSLVLGHGLRSLQALIMEPLNYEGFFGQTQQIAQRFSTHPPLPHFFHLYTCSARPNKKCSRQKLQA